MVSTSRALSTLADNFTSLRWWRNRVFVPYVVGTATRLYPGYPSYDQAVTVMEEDWDTLVVLDACRADVFEQVVDLTAFDSYDRVVSQGSHSSEWTRRNFSGKSFGDAVYVSANPHTTLLADDAFHDLIEVWKEHEPSPNMIDPTHMVRAAKDAYKRYPDKRLIIHFMQPHGTGGLVEEGLSREETYSKTTERIVDVVLDMIDDMDGKTVVTADHGELFSTGLKQKLGVDQHKARLRLPGLVYVPWAVVEGTRREITTGRTKRHDTDSNTVEQRLRDLGYHA